MDVSVKRALIAQSLHLNRLYFILLYHPLPHHVSHFAARHSSVPLLHIHAVIFKRMHFTDVLYRARRAATPLDLLSSQWKCCHSALARLLPVSEALVLALGGGFWLQARGPCQQARNDVAHNLQMLACIRG